MNDLGYSLDYADYCSAWKVNTQGPARRPCNNAARHSVEGIVFLCDQHYRMVEKLMYAKSIELRDAHTISLQAQLASVSNAEILRDDRAVAEAQNRSRLSAVKGSQVVYFIRCERFVKIGISIDAEKRLKTIRTSGGSMFPRGMDVGQSVLLGTAPGGRARESELHERFDYLRHTGEWFTETPELTDYIKKAITS